MGREGGDKKVMCGPSGWDEGEIRRMMNAGEVSMKERI
jgi:hypothetical protein